MRLRLAIAVTALTVLAACDQAPGSKDSARAPIGTAAAPAAVPAKRAAAPNCPTVAPACPPTIAKAQPKAKAHRAKPKAVAHYAAARSKAKAGRRSYAQADEDVMAGLPPRPYRYDELYPAPRWEREEAYEMDRRHRRDHSYRHGEGYSEQRRGDRHGRVHEGRQERRYESYSEQRSGYSQGAYSSFAEEDDCHCGSGVQAAGFDGRGFLTWPGKVPAR